MIDIYRRILAGADVDPGFKGLMGFYMTSPSPSARAQHIMRCLTDLDQSGPCTRPHRRRRASVAGLLRRMALLAPRFVPRGFPPMPARAAAQQRPPYGAAINLETAKKVGAAAVAEARKNNWNVAVAIVDNHGLLVYCEMFDVRRPRAPRRSKVGCRSSSAAR